MSNNVTMANHAQDTLVSPVSPLEPEPEPVPIPSAYGRQISYNNSAVTSQIPPAPAAPPVHTSEKHQDIVEVPYELDEGSEKGNDKTEGSRKLGKRQTSVLIFLRDSRIYIRVLAIMIMIISFSLILVAVIKYDQAKQVPGNPLATVPVPPLGITDYPCRVFTGIAAMNLALSIIILSLSYLSSKFRKSVNAYNAIFAILGAIGFASSMGACFFLKKQVNLKSDLWKWSCDNLKNGISSPALDFEVVCHVVDYGWKFGLVQASLELLTFLVSIVAFVLLKYSYFARYGVVGKIF